MTMSWTPAGLTAAMLRGPLALAGLTVDACVQGARVFWSFWRPLGEPVINAVEIAGQLQHWYLDRLADLLDGVGVGD